MAAAQTHFRVVLVVLHIFFEILPILCVLGDFDDFVHFWVILAYFFSGLCFQSQIRAHSARFGHFS